MISYMKKRNASFNLRNETLRYKQYVWSG
ncbi:hypothetical protein RSC2_03738 [Bacillus paralicheniformis]|nr:hypothetical protein RSC1_01881 [Bacillus paralicheniformis]BCE11942.1 hypothetical protein RSC2_03738 [Bacillus paralicheniformis]BCE13557.1 hypothetical protein RSC3_00913 [Bacillus paralicheniformis]